LVVIFGRWIGYTVNFGSVFGGGFWLLSEDKIDRVAGHVPDSLSIRPSARLSLLVLLAS